MDINKDFVLDRLEFIKNLINEDSLKPLINFDINDFENISNNIIDVSYLKISRTAGHIFRCILNNNSNIFKCC
jgi:hypothetical protein